MNNVIDDIYALYVQRTNYNQIKEFLIGLGFVDHEMFVKDILEKFYLWTNWGILQGDTNERVLQAMGWLESLGVADKRPYQLVLHNIQLLEAIPEFTQNNLLVYAGELLEPWREDLENYSAWVNRVVRNTGRSLETVSKGFPVALVVIVAVILILKLKP